MAENRQSAPVLLDHSQAEVATAIWQLRQAAYGVEAEFLGVGNFPPLQKSRSEIESDVSQYYAIESAGELLGLVELESCGQHEGAITLASLLVEPVLHRQGVGSALLAFIQDLSWIRQIEVETSALNDPALSFYRKQGFTQVSKRITDDGFELIRLQWNL